jgi:hypothetical protein
MSSPVFEVRMPACDRPEMLRRAINSLRAQTYPDWKAIVFDDSTSSEARNVVDGIGDARIVYKRNETRAGAAANIDQCFSPRRIFSGRYGCILEDDNFWLPDFLSLIVGKLANGNVPVILANQRINEEGIGLRPNSETTRGRWFSAGLVAASELRATLLFTEGLSNGGLVWRLEEPRVDLRVGRQVGAAGLQEVCRSLLVDGFFFVGEAEAVWTSMAKSATARVSETNRSFGRGVQSIRRFILQAGGRPLLEVARGIANRLELTRELVEAVAYSGFPSLAGELLRIHPEIALRALIKGAAIRLVQDDPCKRFLASLASGAERGTAS